MIDQRIADAVLDEMELDEIDADNVSAFIERYNSFIEEDDAV